MTSPGSSGIGAWACAGVFVAALSPGAAAGAAGAPATETVVEIRIHGNYSIPNDEVVNLAGIALGDVVDSDVLDAVARRLTDSGRFETVEVRKRYRSLTATDRIAVVIVVRERPRGFGSRLMFAPILGYEEGYGIAYGMRFDLVDVPVPGGQFSVPMTWGGNRRRAFEVESPFGNGPHGRFRGGGSFGRRMHPHFETEDHRSRLWGGFDRRLAGVRVDVEVSWEEVVFGELADRLTRVIVGLEYASLSSAFPRDDVKLRAAVERLSVGGQPAAVFRPHVDVQAFKGIGGQAVLAARVLYEGASAPLPPYERSLLGGARTLRGWKAGARVGDQLLATSFELRLPLNSPLVADKTGFRLFYDTAAVWNAGSVRDQWLNGVGVGVFLSLPVVGPVQFDVGHDLRGGVVVHWAAGFEF